MIKKIILFLLLLPLIVLAQEKVDINTATIEELKTITGIGSTYAQRIIDARPFSSIDDLIKVKGIGEKTLEKIKDQGLAFVEEKSTETPDVGAGLPRPDEQEGEKTSPLQVYSSEIKFSEFLPSPEGPDSENEWIEIYNSNEFEVDLSGWIIKDTTGSVKEYTLNNKIPTLGYLVFKRTETQITLNNDGDGLILLNPNKEVVDSINFGKAVQGQSYIKTDSEWTWTTTPTSNTQNQKTIPQKQSTKTVEVGPRTISTQEKLPEDARLPDGQGPRAIKLVDNLERSFKVSVVFVGFLVALCSAIAFLIIKNNLKNFWY